MREDRTPVLSYNCPPDSPGMGGHTKHGNRPAKEGKAADTAPKEWGVGVGGAGCWGGGWGGVVLPPLPCTICQLSDMWGRVGRAGSIVALGLK